jgi:hypothetical protein
MKQDEGIARDVVPVSEKEERQNLSNKNDRLLFALSLICIIFAK